MTGQERRILAAPCGLYCGACSLYVAQKRNDAARIEAIAKQSTQRQGVTVTIDDLACDGCLSSEKIALYCRSCALRDCTRGRGITQCSQCSDFPCQPLVDFNNDGWPHHTEVLSSVRHQKEIGIEIWLDEQEKRWRCPSCGSAIDWYARQCPQCGEALPKQF